jgi:hypothetical protein
VCAWVVLCMHTIELVSDPRSHHFVQHSAANLTTENSLSRTRSALVYSRQYEFIATAQWSDDGMLCRFACFRVLCLMSYVLCLMSYVLCLMSYAACLMPHVLCKLTHQPSYNLSFHCACRVWRGKPGKDRRRLRCFYERTFFCGFSNPIILFVIASVACLSTSFRRSSVLDWLVFRGLLFSKLSYARLRISSLTSLIFIQGTLRQ